MPERVVYPGRVVEGYRVVQEGIVQGSRDQYMAAFASAPVSPFARLASAAVSPFARFAPFYRCFECREVARSVRKSRKWRKVDVLWTRLEGHGKHMCPCYFNRSLSNQLVGGRTKVTNSDAITGDQNRHS